MTLFSCEWQSQMKNSFMSLRESIYYLEQYVGSPGVRSSTL